MRLEVDVEVALRIASEVTRKFPFAASNAITRVAKEAVEAGKAEIAADFTIRKKFVIDRVQVLEYSKPSTLTAVIGINTKVQGSPLLLGFFEDGGEKLPSFGSGIAVPITGTDVRPSFQALIKPTWKFPALQIGPDHRGKHKTFIVPGVGVFERVRPGRDPDATKLIYLFEKSAPLGKHMNLRAAFIEKVNSRFPTIFREEYLKEIGKIR